MNREQFLNLNKREQHLHIDGLLYVNNKRLDLNWSNNSSRWDFQEGMKKIEHLIDENIHAMFLVHKGYGRLYIIELSGHIEMYEAIAGYIGYVGLLRKIINYEPQYQSFKMDNKNMLEDHIEL